MNQVVKIHTGQAATASVSQSVSQTAMAVVENLRGRINGQFDFSQLVFKLNDRGDIEVSIWTNHWSRVGYSHLTDLGEPLNAQELQGEGMVADTALIILDALIERGDVVLCEQTGDYFTKDQWFEACRDAEADAATRAAQSHSSNFL